MTNANGRLTMMSVSDAALLACVATFFAGMAAGNKSAHAAPPSYVGAGSYLLPSGSSAFNDEADGRLVCITETGAIVRQSAVNVGGVAAYSPLGSLPAGAVPSFGAGFLKISPDGSRFAIGDNNSASQVHFVQVALLNTSGPTVPQTINVANFDGAWADNATFYVNGSPNFGTAPSLYRVNITTSAVAAVVSNIGDASGGVATRSGRVYTAIGYDVGGLLDGQVRSFDITTLNAAASAVAFSTGTITTQANTGNSLDFDAAGNIIEAGFGGVTIVDLATAQRYDLPGLSPAGFYSAMYNNFTGEILVRDFAFGADPRLVLRYAVPTPATTTLLGLSGILAARRRRHA